MSTLTLVEFLRARLDEDEAVAREVPKPYVSGNWIVEDTFYEGMILVDRHGVAEENETTRHMTRWSPARVLADVKAKRAIVRDYDEAVSYFAAHPMAPAGEVHGIESALKRLAAAYADHPDYDATWAP
jgi:hypothetical protein